MLAWYILSSCVCLSHSGIVSKWRSIMQIMLHDSPGTLRFSGAKDHVEIQMGSSPMVAPNIGGVG